MSEQDPVIDPAALDLLADLAPLTPPPAPDRQARMLDQRLLGQRLSGLASDLIDRLDRLRLECGTDARRWAAEPAVAACLSGSPGAARAVSRIIANRVPYLDLWIADASGRVVATARPDTYPGMIGHDVSAKPWFRAALAAGPGGSVTSEIATVPGLGGALTLPFASAVGGPEQGVLALFLDWTSQITPLLHHARQRGGGTGVRCLLLDGEQRVIADTAPDDRRLPPPPFVPATTEPGWYPDRHDIVIGYARTPTAPGMGGAVWHGIVARRVDQNGRLH